jgi:hypothetical protein
VRRRRKAGELRDCLQQLQRTVRALYPHTRRGQVGRRADEMRRRGRTVVDAWVLERQVLAALNSRSVIGPCDAERETYTCNTGVSCKRSWIPKWTGEPTVEMREDNRSARRCQAVAARRFYPGPGKQSSGYTKYSSSASAMFVYYIHRIRSELVFPGTHFHQNANIDTHATIAMGIHMTRWARICLRFYSSKLEA